MITSVQEVRSAAQLDQEHMSALTLSEYISSLTIIINRKTKQMNVGDINYLIIRKYSCTDNIVIMLLVIS